jgi:3-oxoadipate enol-lactonase
MCPSEKNIRISVNDIMVLYNDEGPKDSTVIIFIHGFPLNKSMWDKQLEVLKTDYRVIAYDVRGHGFTDIGKLDFSIELFVEDLIALMDTLKIASATICGLSMGGYIALNAIEKYPERFDALILSDTQCTADSAEQKAKRLITIETIKTNGLENFADESIKNLFAPESFTFKKAERGLVKEMILHTSEQSLSNTLQALANRKETCESLGKIKVPTLILVGDQDKITPLSASQFMESKINGSILQIIDRAGHISNMEKPIEFNSQIKNFMSTFVKTQRSNEILA